MFVKPNRPIIDVTKDSEQVAISVVIVIAGKISIKVLY